MKLQLLASSAILAMFLAGCSQEAEGQSKIQALNARVDRLTEQVKALQERSVSADFQAEAKCAEEARKTFEFLGYSNKADSDLTISSYVSHFDSKLGKCFMLITQSSLKQGLINRLLIDANTQISYGTLAEMGGKPFLCELHPDGDLDIVTSKANNCSTDQQFIKFAWSYLGTTVK